MCLSGTAGWVPFIISRAPPPPPEPAGGSAGIGADFLPGWPNGAPSEAAAAAAAAAGRGGAPPPFSGHRPGPPPNLPSARSCERFSGFTLPAAPPSATTPTPVVACRCPAGLESGYPGPTRCQRGSRGLAGSSNRLPSGFPDHGPRRSLSPPVSALIKTRLLSGLAAKDSPSGPRGGSLEG